MIPVRALPEIRSAIVAAEHLLPEDQRGTEVTRRHAATLRRAPLWWANSDMTQLAVGAAETLPPWTPMITRPTPTGFMVWNEPIGKFPEALPGKAFGKKASPTLGSALVRAAAWSIDGEMITFTLYGPVMDEAERARSAPMWHNWFEIGVYTTFSTHEFDPALQELGDPYMSKILHVIGASWLLMQQPTVATVKRAKASGGRGAKKKPKKIDTVQIIELRRLATDRTDQPKTPGEGREYHHRWLVRGHWRQQRVGPGRKYVRPVYVAPHIKGPDDAPLKTDRVHAWRR